MIYLQRNSTSSDGSPSIEIAVGVVGGLILTGVLARRGVDAWWLMPLAVTLLLAVSLWREVRQAG